MNRIGGILTAANEFSFIHVGLWVVFMGSCARWVNNVLKTTASLLYVQSETHIDSYMLGLHLSLLTH